VKALSYFPWWAASCNELQNTGFHNDIKRMRGIEEDKASQRAFDMPKNTSVTAAVAQWRTPHQVRRGRLDHKSVPCTRTPSRPPVLPQPHWKNVQYNLK